MAVAVPEPEPAAEVALPEQMAAEAAVPEQAAAGVADVTADGEVAAFACLENTSRRNVIPAAKIATCTAL